MISWCFVMLIASSGKVLFVSPHLSSAKFCLATHYNARSAYMKSSKKHKRPHEEQRDKRGGERKVECEKDFGGLSKEKKNLDGNLEVRTQPSNITSWHHFFGVILSLYLRQLHNPASPTVTLIIVIELVINVVASVSVVSCWYRRDVCTLYTSRDQVKTGDFLIVNYW